MPRPPGVVVVVEWEVEGWEVMGKVGGVEVSGKTGVPLPPRDGETWPTLISGLTTPSPFPLELPWAAEERGRMG